MHADIHISPKYQMKSLNRFNRDTIKLKEQKKLLQFKRRDLNEDDRNRFYNVNVPPNQLVKIRTELLNVTKADIEKQIRDSNFPPMGIYYRPSKPKPQGLARLPYGFKRQTEDGKKNVPVRGGANIKDIISHS